MSPKSAAACVASILLVTAPLMAEDVSETEQIVCSVQQAALCDPLGLCEEGAPVDWNLPGFIVIDLKEKRLSTTATGARPRATPVQHLRREEGVSYLQGVENGRAFSIVIEERSGLVSAAIATAGITVSAFGECTPLPITPAGRGE